MSELNEHFAGLVRIFGLPKPEREVRFAKELKRQWRFDFYWPEFKLAVELNGLVLLKQRDGSVIVRGGHATVRGMINDMDKRNVACMLGIDVLTFAQQHVVGSHDAIDMTQRMLYRKGWRPARGLK